MWLAIGSADIHYGMAALSEGNYNYIYAQVDIRNDFDPITEVHLARTAIGNPYENWHTPNLLTYNAMAHPQFEKDNMILVSYNLNTLVFAQLFSDVSTYRPRFFWIDIDKILN